MPSSVSDIAIVAATALAALLVGGCGERLGDAPIDHEELKLDACERACATFDTCDPGRFAGMEPEACFDRCMTLFPLLHEQNQCGSRQIIEFRCLGDLSCEEFEIADAAGITPPDYSVPCMAERLFVTSCSTDEPFDLEEPAPQGP